MASDKKPSQISTDALEQDDIALFRRSVSDARPLGKTFLEPTPPSIPRKARFTRRDEQAVLNESMDTDFGSLEESSGEHLRFARPVIGRKIMRKLSRGGFSIGAETDLHGMTTSQARTELRDFIEYCVQRGLTCVRVIHGKGLGSGLSGPVLKRKVDVWLRQWDPVLAFVSARPVDGGTGALYVLLKKP
jgi:DNA-nicking Smr family endonuclease